MQCVLYARVSTERQANRDLSIPAQLRVMREHVARHGWTELDTYIDAGASGRNRRRPQLQAMLSRCRKRPQVDAVLIHKIDRLARDVCDYAFIRAYLKRHHVRLVSVVEPSDETPTGQLLEHIMAAMAEFYSANLSEETKKGLNMVLQRGGWPHLAPRGYKNIRDASGRAGIAIDPQMAPSVRRAFELYGSGRYSFDALDQQLASEQLPKPCPRGHHRQLLSNPFYAGRIRVHGRTAAGAHLPLVSTDMFECVQQELERRRFRYGRAPVHAFPLRGLVWCAGCGGKMTTDTSKGFRYYHCWHKNRHECRLKYSRADDVHEAVRRVYSTVPWTEDLKRRLQEAGICNAAAASSAAVVLARLHPKQHSILARAVFERLLIRDGGVFGYSLRMARTSREQYTDGRGRRSALYYR